MPSAHGDACRKRLQDGTAEHITSAGGQFTCHQQPKFHVPRVTDELSCIVILGGITDTGLQMGLLTVAAPNNPILVLGRGVTGVRLSPDSRLSRRGSPGERHSGSPSPTAYRLQPGLASARPKRGSSKSTDYIY